MPTELSAAIAPAASSRVALSGSREKEQIKSVDLGS